MCISVGAMYLEIAVDRIREGRRNLKELIILSSGD